MTLALYSDRAYVPRDEPHVIMLYPFWGKNPEDPADPNTGRFDRYAAEGARFFSFSSLEEAALAVYPRDLSRAGALRDLPRFVDAAREAATPTVAFFSSDSAEPVAAGATVFRTSLYRSRRQPDEFALPAWSEDFVERYLDGVVPLRRKSGCPVVGFCGLAPTRSFPPPRLRASRPAAIRGRVLDALGRDPEIETNFVVRDRFLAGALARGRVDAATMQRVRREYVDNMVASDYVVCVRGAGNFSYRLYETLSCGRIPVFVDTDCVLPYEFLVDWRDYMVWIDERDVARAGEHVREFHERLSESEFRELQQAVRRLWEAYLAPEGFFGHFAEHFEVSAVRG